MITPIEIQNKSFKSGGLGYDKKDVDGFLREVLRSYEQIYRENMELSDKVAVLSEGIQYYKTIEKTLQKALVLAEKTAEDTKAAALEKAKAIEKEANTRSQLIVADAKNELDQIHYQTIQLIQQYEKYKCQFKNLAKVQMELIESDCFNINVTRLDAFVDLTNDKTTSKSVQQTTQKHITKSDKNQVRMTEYRDQRIDLSKEDLKQEELPIQVEDSFFTALEQASVTSEELDDSYKEAKSYPNHQVNNFQNVDDVDDVDDEYDEDDEEEEPHNQNNEFESQEEFSFINLLDDED